MFFNRKRMDAKIVFCPGIPQEENRNPQGKLHDVSVEEGIGEPRSGN